MDLKQFLAKMEKLLLPGFLFCFEFVFLVLFGLLVRYDTAGSPDAELEKALALMRAGRTPSPEELLRELESTLSTTKTYPCESQMIVDFAIRSANSGMALRGPLKGPVQRIFCKNLLQTCAFCTVGCDLTLQISCIFVCGVSLLYGEVCALQIPSSMQIPSSGSPPYSLKKVLVLLCVCLCYCACMQA